MRYILKINIHIIFEQKLGGVSELILLRFLNLNIRIWIYSCIFIKKSLNLNRKIKYLAYLYINKQNKTIIF